MPAAIRYEPARPLGCFVKTIWYYAGYTQPHAFERLLPDGTLALIVNLDDDFSRIYDSTDTNRFQCLPGAIAMGAQSGFFVIDTAGQRHVLGVQFRAGGAFPFLGMPADELAGLHISLEDLWGSRARALRERLLAAPSPRERCRIMESALIAEATGQMEIRPEVGFGIVSLENPAWSVAQVVAETGLSERRYAEVFRASVGMTPKAYARVRRFQTALRSIQSSAAPDWPSIALACGYFDQAHFNHDFRAFSGINPSTYVAKRTAHLNHVPMD